MVYIVSEIKATGLQEYLSWHTLQLANDSGVDRPVMMTMVHLATNSSIAKDAHN